MSQKNQKINYFPQTRGHSEYNQATYQQAYGYTHPMQSVPSNSGHDMNKQLAAAQSAMYTNSGGMANTVQQHHQSQMGGPVPSQQPASIVQQGQQLNRGPMGQMQINHNLYQRNMPQRQTMTRTQLAPVVHQPGQQPTSQYSAPVQMFHNMHNPGIHNAMQPMMINNFTPGVYQTRPIQQYVPPAAVYVNNYMQYQHTQQANTNGFYPAHGIPPYNHPIPPQIPQPQQQQPPPVAAQQTQQRSKAVAIIDPNTGKNIFDASNDESNASSMQEKEQDNDSNIGIQFASQVAATLVNNKTESLKLSVEEVRGIAPPTAILCSNEMETGRPTEIDSISESQIMDAVDISELPEDESLNQMGYYEAPRELIENCNLPPPNDSYPTVFKPTLNQEEIAWKPSIKQECVPGYEDEVLHQNAEPAEYKEPISEPDDLPVQEVNVDVGLKPDDVSVHDDMVGAKGQRILYVNAKEPEVTKSIDAIPASLNSLVKDEVKTVEPTVELETSQSAAIHKAAEKSENKKNKTKKKKDYNKRVESKEGGEMDAFIVDNKVEQEAPVASPATPTVPSVAPVVERTPSPVHIVDSEILNTIPLPGETYENIPQNDISPSEPISDTSSVSPTVDSENKENAPEETPKMGLKYSYKEDQWSPLNPEGKKQYDRDFLLLMQSQPMSLCKPTNLPNLDVIKDKAHIQRLSEINRSAQLPPPAQVRTYNDPFMPTYARGGAPGRLPHPPINRRSQTGGRGGEKVRKIISFTSSLSQSVKLHESENAWKPMYKVETVETNPDNWDREKLKRSVQGVLNKLTPQKFETLLAQLKSLNIDTEEKLNIVIDLIFEKAIDEPNFSVPYANLCKHLAQVKVPISGQQGAFVNFRKLLLIKCQKEFEQDNRFEETDRDDKIKAIEAAEPDKKKVLQAELDALERKMRYRQLGNIRFIGELFKLGMLIEPIMHDCIKKLLSQEDEESLECLCRLLKTIGKELEEGKSSKNSRENAMDMYFNQMQNVVEGRGTSSRVRFMLQDVIDLKKSNWVPRRDDNTPKTIDQIHKEVEREAREQQLVFQNTPNFPKRMPDDRDRRKPNRNLGQSEDGWTPSSKTNKGSYSSVDPSKLKLTKPDEVESIRLGPGGRGLSSWGRGSSGGNKAPESDNKTALTNRYSALADQNQPFEGRRGSQRSAASSRESSRGRNSQLPSSIRKTSSSKERESLLETVKGMARSNDSKPVDVKKKDVHLNGKSVDSNELVLRGTELDEEEMEKKTKPLVDEFLHNADFEEAVKCVTEQVSPNTVHMFINSAINQVLERSTQARHMLGQLLCTLVKKNIITFDQYRLGFVEILGMLNEYSLDIPKIKEYMGEILAPLVEDNVCPFQCLREILKPCITDSKGEMTDYGGLVVSCILHSAGNRKGTMKLGELWRESGLEWREFLKSDTDVDEFIRNHKLEFTLCPTKLKQMPMTYEEMKENLLSLLKKSEENEEIFDWIDANVSEDSENDFIRALVTAVHEDAISVAEQSHKLDAARLKKRSTLLTRYINSNEKLEMQALYAIQFLMNKLGHPSGLLHQIFNILYDDDVINEEAFKKWEQSDMDETEGKGVAVHSTRSFFTWLRESDEDDANA